MPASSAFPAEAPLLLNPVHIHLVAAVLVAFLLLVGVLPALAVAQEATPASASPRTTASPLPAASSWLRAQQMPDGGFPGFTGNPDPATTTDAVLALFAAQEADPDAAAALAAAVAFLEPTGAAYAETGPGQAAKLALAAVAGGRDPRDFAGLDLVAAMTAALATPVTAAPAGIYGDDLYDHALILIALAASGETIPEAAIEPLRATQTTDGGWAYDGSTGPGAADSNTTALLIQALAAAGRAPDPMVDGALPFLATLRAPDGTGFAFGPTDPLVADANSTALVIQALIATGEDPAAAAWGNAPQALALYQTPAGGLRYLLGDDEPNLLATLQAIPALADRPLPVASACALNEPASTDDCIPLAPAA
jgi:hypothetical protein